MVVAMQRYAQDQVSEVATSRLHLPDEESKGKIIGKEGRNIRSLEQSTGVQVIIDDTPETITLSSFDPIRRQVAKMAIEHLIDDGRIQPSRIELFVQEAQETIHQHIKEAGEQALYEMNITGIDPQLIYILGRLQFRHSYGQNVLRHSLEVSHLSAALAAELGANVQVAKIAGLFHDVGKALDHELEGSHVEIGRMLLSRYTISEEVIKAMQAHHEEYPYETIESRIVQVADTLSASRPGARKNSAQNYLQRLRELEAVSNAFEGVEKSYALNAGREIRVFVTPEEITDFQAQNLARDIALRIEDSLQYPGEIKVTLIRETRIIDYAR
jgi:ribonuclease Y